jgi:hypothetical protein
MFGLFCIIDDSAMNITKQDHLASEPLEFFSAVQDQQAKEEGKVRLELERLDSNLSNSRLDTCHISKDQSIMILCSHLGIKNDGVGLRVMQSYSITSSICLRDIFSHRSKLFLEGANNIYQYFMKSDAKSAV